MYQRGEVQYEYEKPGRSVSVISGESRAPAAEADWRRAWPSGGGGARAESNALGSEACRSGARPAVICSRMHVSKPTVPLKVWVVASASCFAVCAALVLATVVITKWGTVDVSYHLPKPYHRPSPAKPPQSEPLNRIEENPTSSDENENSSEIDSSILEKMSIFKNIISHRENHKLREPHDDKKKHLKNEGLVGQQQIYPEHDTTLIHSERKIEKKDQPKIPKDHVDAHTKITHKEEDDDSENEIKKNIPDFKPTLPDVFLNKHEIKLPDGYVAGLRKYDSEYYNNEDFYNDDNLYDDYVQSNTMTNYLIEKIQELYEWITTDPELEGVKKSTQKLFMRKGENSSNNEFGQLLIALNESIVEGNVTIVMLKLKELYFGGDNFTSFNQSNRKFLRNSTDLLSFGMLSLDVMLLHNIQLMAWESQESSRVKMLQEPDVFAFNALFLDPSKVEAERQEVLGYKDSGGQNKRQNQRQDEEPDVAKGLFENMIELGLSTARAAIHLGRAYKNARATINQISNRDSTNTNIQLQLAKNSDSNSRALDRLRTSYRREEHAAPAFSELDCVWLLYCKNLVATGKLSSPFGTMARINGVALRMLVGELAAEKALDTLLLEAVAGWTELRCADMFPRCSRADAASVVLDSILQPHRRAHPPAAT